MCRGVAEVNLLDYSWKVSKDTSSKTRVGDTINKMYLISGLAVTIDRAPAADRCSPVYLHFLCTTALSVLPSAPRLAKVTLHLLFPYKSGPSLLGAFLFSLLQRNLPASFPHSCHLSSKCCKTPFSLNSKIYP